MKRILSSDHLATTLSAVQDARSSVKGKCTYAFPSTNIIDYGPISGNNVTSLLIWWFLLFRRYNSHEMRRSSTSFVGCLVVSILLSSLFIWISLCLFQLAISDDCQSCWWWRHERHFASCYIRTEGSFSHQTEKRGPKVTESVHSSLNRKKENTVGIFNNQKEILWIVFSLAHFSLSPAIDGIFFACVNTQP